MIPSYFPSTEQIPGGKSFLAFHTQRQRESLPVSPLRLSPTLEQHTSKLVHLKSKKCLASTDLAKLPEGIPGCSVDRHHFPPEPMTDIPWLSHPEIRETVCQWQEARLGSTWMTQCSFLASYLCMWPTLGNDIDAVY